MTKNAKEGPKRIGSFFIIYELHGAALETWNAEEALWKRHKKDSIESLLSILSSWRRRRDLNPRAGIPTYSLSRGAPSASWVLLHSTVAFEKMAEREGFEPPVPCDITGFQDRLHKPLEHLSACTGLVYPIAAQLATMVV